MSSEELFIIKGGTTLNTSLLNAISKFLIVSLEIGRTLGTTIRRALDKNKC